MNTPTFVDLFAGAGGLSEGFVDCGFLPVAYIEKDIYSSLTIKTRSAYHYLNKKRRLNIYHEFLRQELSRDELYRMIPDENLDTVITDELNEGNSKKLAESIMRNLDSSYDGIDVLIGGPPCQAYSLVGRARDQYGKEHDPRNYLYRIYIKFLKTLRPKIFVFENVPGLISAGNGKLFKDIRKKFHSAGYEIKYELLNAHDFGVLQRRKRIILIGWRREFKLAYPEFNKHPVDYLVRDVLLDLPPLHPGESIEYGEYAGPPTGYLLRYGLRKKNDILTLHITRSHNDRDRHIYRMAIEMWRNKRRRLKYTDIPDKYRTHKNITSFLDRFKVVADDLPYSHTVVAHIAKDGHYYIHPDIMQLRSLSVREAARLQSFPDNYYFEGPRTSKFAQIGNAVPPIMAKKIAYEINKMLGEI